MKQAFVKSKDFYAGMLFAAIGLSVVVIAADYGMTSGGYIGPGYFPTFVGALLALVGVAMMVTTIWKGLDPIDGGWHLRPLLLILGSVVGFALLIKSTGLAISAIVLVIGCSLADSNFRLVRTLVLSVALTAFTIAVFIYGLGLPLRAF